MAPRLIVQPHPSLLYPHTLTARRLRRLCPSHPFRLAPLAVGAPVPLPRRRCGLRPPPASASPPCSDVHTTASVSTVASGRWRSLHTPFPNKATWSGPHPSTPSLPATSPHPHGSPPSAPLPLSPLSPRSARRRHRRPASASPARASPATGFRIPPCSDVHTTASASTHASGRWRSLHTSFPNKATWSRASSFNPIPHCYIPTPSRLAALNPSASLRSSSTPPSRIRVAGAGFARLRLPHPPLLRYPHHRARHYPRLRSLALPRTSFANKAAWSGPTPSTPSLPATSPHPHGSPPSAPLPLSTPPPRSARRRHRRPASASPARASPATGFRIPPCSVVRTTAGATAHASGRSRSLRTSFANKAPWSMPTPSTPSLPATSPHPHGSPPSAPLPPSTPPPRSARRRRPRPASASPARASPASGFRIPPCSDIHTTASATTHTSGRWHSLHTSFPNKAASSMPTPSTPSLPATSPHPHGSPPSAPLPPSTPPPRSARRRRRRPTSTPPARASPASGFPHPPLLRCPHHRQRHYRRLRSLALPPHFLRQQGGMVRAPSFNPIPPCYIPSPSRLAAFGAFAALTPPPRSARRRHRRPASASPVRASPASGFRIPPCSDIHTTASATTHTSGRWHSLHTSFPNKAASSMPTPSTPSLPATSPHPHGSPPSAPLPPSTPPPRSARRRRRRPTSTSPVRASPASGFRIPPCSDVRTTSATAVSSFGSDRHSVAVAAPFHGFRRRRFPLAHTLGFFVPDRRARLWSSHHRVASLRRLRCSSPASSCAIAASPHAASFRHRSSHHHRCP